MTTRPTDAELDAWLTPWGYPPAGVRANPPGWPHSHPCPDGHGWPSQAVYRDAGVDAEPFWYRWDCPHERHGQPVEVAPFPRDLAAAVWRAEHGSPGL